MSLLNSKLARQSAVGLSAAALIAGLVVPATALGQEITLRRNTIQVPIAAQLNAQKSSQAAVAASKQSNDLDQSAVNANKGLAANSFEQDQDVSNRIDDQTNVQKNDVDVDSEAKAFAVGGDTTAIGPNAKVNFTPVIVTDASVAGDASATSSTGDAGGDVSQAASGDSEANGGSGNGNAVAASLAAQLKSGNAHSSTDADAGDGGNAYAKGEADSDGGNGGKANSGLNGNGAKAASVAAQLTARRGESGDNSAGDASNRANSGDANGGYGGASTADASGNSASGGYGGAAYGNYSTAAAEANNSSGDSSATSGNGNGMGGYAGHTQQGAGGEGNSGWNKTEANLVGGIVENAVVFEFSQQGNAEATGGSTANYGSAQSNPAVSTWNTASNDNSQTASPSQDGTGGNASVDQAAWSNQEARQRNAAENAARNAAVLKAGGDSKATAER